MSDNKKTKLTPSQKLNKKLAGRIQKQVDAACAKLDTKISDLRNAILVLEREQEIMRATVPVIDEPEAA